MLHEVRVFARPLFTVFLPLFSFGTLLLRPGRRPTAPSVLARRRKKNSMPFWPTSISGSQARQQHCWQKQRAAEGQPSTLEQARLAMHISQAPGQSRDRQRRRHLDLAPAHRPATLTAFLAAPPPSVQSSRLRRAALCGRWIYSSGPRRGKCREILLFCEGLSLSSISHRGYYLYVVTPTTPRPTRTYAFLRGGAWTSGQVVLITRQR